MTTDNEQERRNEEALMKDAISKMDKSVECLALELPASVWADVKARWVLLKCNIESLRYAREEQEQACRWVSVEERMPEDSLLKLIALEGHPRPILLAWDKKAQAWIDWQGYYVTKKVTHWLSGVPPIPEKEARHE